MLSSHDQRALMVVLAAMAFGAEPAVAAPSEVPVEAWVSPPAGRSLGDARGPLVGFGEGVDRNEDGSTRARVWSTLDGLHDLERRGWSVELTPPPGPPPDGYHSPEQASDALRELAAIAPRGGHAEIGRSLEGRPIDALWLGQPPGSDARVVRLLGAHHGDEWSSFEVPLDIARTLVEGDGLEPSVTEFLDVATVWIVPMVNPDGVAGDSRFNARWVDLNRNYDFQWSADEFLPGEHPFSEPETRAIRSWAHWERPMIALSAHSGDTNIGWVWNYTEQPAADLAILAPLAQAYTALCTTPDFYATNGASWYVTEGDTNDWSYGHYGVLDFTVELTLVKAPDPDRIDTYTQEHRLALLSMLAVKPTLSGTVTDAQTGLPIEAQLQLVGDVDTTPFVSSPTSGRFDRVSTSGLSTLLVAAPGYSATSIEVEIGQPEATQLAIALSDLGQIQAPIEPAVVQPGGSVELPLDVLGPTTWIHAGSTPRDFPVVDGRVQLDARMPPGWWSVATPSGGVWRNAVLVEEPEQATLTGWQVADGTLTISGRGFATGTRILGVWGPGRPIRELVVVDERATEIVAQFDADPDDLVDLAVISGGATLGIHDPHTGKIPKEEPNQFSNETLVVGTPGCACHAAPGHCWPALLSFFSMALFRRRPTC